MSDADSDSEIWAATQAGMTPDEAACWDLTRLLANGMLGLPELHPLDREEVAKAIHIVQDKLLGRPTYRRYIEIIGRESLSESHSFT